MATTGAPGNIPLFDDNTPVTPIQEPFNAMAKALNASLKGIMPISGQVRSLSTNSLGQFTVTHNAGYVPTAIVVSSVGGSGANEFTYRIWSRDDKKFIVKVWYGGVAWVNGSLDGANGVDWVIFP